MFAGIDTRIKRPQSSSSFKAAEILGVHMGVSRILLDFFGINYRLLVQKNVSIPAPFKSNKVNSLP
jgi:hypothetical protein